MESQLVEERPRLTGFSDDPQTRIRELEEYALNLVDIIMDLERQMGMFDEPIGDDEQA